LNSLQFIGKYTSDKTLQKNDATKDATNVVDGYKMESAIHKVSYFYKSIQSFIFLALNVSLLQCDPKL